MTVAVHTVLMMLIALQAKHFIADGPLQTRAMVEAKGVFGKPLGLLHAMLHGIGTGIVFLAFGFPVGVVMAVAGADACVHYVIDFGKEQTVRRAGWTTAHAYFWWALSADQTLHQMTYVTLVWLFVTTG
jgi:Protein of unknown function (DUF3307)